MAKVTGPLMSMTASGKLAGAIVFTVWKGIAVVRKYVTPKNPNTANQQTIRGYFSTLVTSFMTLTGADKVAWNASAAGKPYSGYNLFMSQAMKVKDAGDDWYTFKSVSSGTISASGATITNTKDKAGKTKVHYGVNPGVYPFEKEAAASSDSGVAGTVDLTGLSDATKYYYYVSLTDGDGQGRSGEYSFTTLAS
jgi:hypothetical protein